MLLGICICCDGSHFHEVMNTPQFLNENFFQQEDWDALDARENPHWDPFIEDWVDGSPQALEQLLRCEQFKDVFETR